MRIRAKITYEISKVILKEISEWYIPPKMAKNRLFTSLREDPGFIPSPFPLSYSPTFYNSLSTKSTASAFTMSQTVVKC